MGSYRAGYFGIGHGYGSRDVILARQSAESDAADQGRDRLVVVAHAYEACLAHVDEFSPQQRTTLHLKSGDGATSTPLKAANAGPAVRHEPAPKLTREDYARISD